ncbi:MAG: hypothetical protein ABIL49_06640 [candidate division WOR-3 bacterium]|jgi:hypothetical protein
MSKLLANNPIFSAFKIETSPQNLSIPVKLVYKSIIEGYYESEPMDLEHKYKNEQELEIIAFILNKVIFYISVVMDEYSLLGREMRQIPGFLLEVIGTLDYLAKMQKEYGERREKEHKEAMERLRELEKIIFDGLKNKNYSKL